MRLHRFYTTQKIGEQKEIDISEERIVHQVQKVLRLKTGDRIVVFDGKGKDFECEIISHSKSNLKLRITNFKLTPKPKREVTLFMSIIKKENFELACEKATELGVSKIVPVVTERTLAKNLNLDRIEKILIEASEQSGRGSVPLLAGITNLELGITNEIKEGKEVIVADMGGVSFKHLSLTTDYLSLLVGPEGGWTESERKMFKEKNLKTVSLGVTVLRAETAAIVATFLAFNL